MNLELKSRTCGLGPGARRPYITQWPPAWLLGVPRPGVQVPQTERPTVPATGPGQPRLPDPCRCEWTASEHRRIYDMSMSSLNSSCKASNGGNTRAIFQAHQGSEATPFSSLLGLVEQLYVVLMPGKALARSLSLSLDSTFNFNFASGHPISFCSPETPKYQKCSLWGPQRHQ